MPILDSKMPCIEYTFNIVKPDQNYYVVLWPKPKKEHLRKIGNLRVNLRQGILLRVSLNHLVVSYMCV